MSFSSLDTTPAIRAGFAVLNRVLADKAVRRSPLHGSPSCSFFCELEFPGPKVIILVREWMFVEERLSPRKPILLSWMRAESFNGVGQIESVKVVQTVLVARSLLQGCTTLIVA